MGIILPFSQTTTRDDDPPDLEELVWQTGGYIRRRQIASETPLRFVPCPIGTPYAKELLTPHVDTSAIYAFIREAIELQGVHGLANAYCLTRTEHGPSGAQTTLAIMLFHISDILILPKDPPSS